MTSVQPQDGPLPPSLESPGGVPAESVTQRREATWPFGPKSAAYTVAKVAWPNDTQVDQWSPRMLTDPYLRDQTIREARERFELAIAAIIPEVGDDWCGVCAGGRGQHRGPECVAGEFAAMAAWNDSGKAVREGPWESVGLVLKRSLIEKAAATLPREEES